MRLPARDSSKKWPGKLTSVYLGAAQTDLGEQFESGKACPMG